MEAKSAASSGGLLDAAAADPHKTKSVTASEVIDNGNRIWAMKLTNPNGRLNPGLIE